jgi:hypothetical protein
MNSIILFYHFIVPKIINIGGLQGFFTLLLFWKMSNKDSSTPSTPSTPPRTPVGGKISILVPNKNAVYTLVIENEKVMLEEVKSDLPTPFKRKQGKKPPPNKALDFVSIQTTNQNRVSRTAVLPTIVHDNGVLWETHCSKQILTQLIE